MEGEYMVRHRLSDDAWEAIRGLFAEPARTGRPRRDPRDIVDAILWVLRTGSPWRDLPAEFGPWQTAWHLLDRWTRQGRWDALLDQLRAARGAAGGGKKKIPRSRPTTPWAARAAASPPRSTSCATGTATRCTST